MKREQLKFIMNPSIARIFRILEEIEVSKTFTIEKLAEINEVSPRTTVSDIRYLKDFFGDSVLMEHGKYGYIFKVISAENYFKKKKELLKNEFLLDIISNIFYGDSENIAEISHQYNVSESSLRRILTYSESVLLKYELEWQTNPLGIAGNESNLREFFKTFFYEGYQSPFSIIYDEELQRRSEKRFKNKMEYFELGSGGTFKEFYYTIYISIQRFAIGKKIDLPTFLLHKVYKEKDFHLLCELKSDIKYMYGIDLPLEEFAWIFISLICKRTNNNIKKEQTFFEKFNFGTNVELISEKFISRYELKDSVRSNIKIFINTFFLSREINYLICPSANRESTSFIQMVKEDYENLYKDNYNFLNKLCVFSATYISDICASLTMHFVILMDLYQEKKNIYFMFEGDHFISQMVSMHANHLFGNKHNVFFNTFSSLTKEHISYLNDKKVDLIVTNKFEDYVSGYYNELPLVLVKTIPDDKDWEKIGSMLNPYDGHVIDFLMK